MGQASIISHSLNYNSSLLTGLPVPALSALTLHSSSSTGSQRNPFKYQVKIQVLCAKLSNHISSLSQCNNSHTPLAHSTMVVTLVLVLPRTHQACSHHRAFARALPLSGMFIPQICTWKIPFILSALLKWLISERTSMPPNIT